MKLYQINEQLRNLVEHGDCFVDVETGEVFNQEAVDQLQIDREAKIDGIATIIKELTNEVGDLAVEIKALQMRKQAKENRVNWLKKYLQDCLEGQKWENARHAISYRKTKAVLLTDWQKVPEMYFKDQTEKDIAKSALLADLKAGKVIPGCELEERTSMVLK